MNKAVYQKALISPNLGLDIKTQVTLNDEKIETVDALIEVYSSFISPKIDDYNSSVYYENPNYIFECYKENKML